MSGALYADCCKSLAARYLVNESGLVSKIITPPSGGAGILKELEKSFKEVFGRKQGAGDLMLLAGLRYSPEDYRRNFRTISKQAGLPNFLVYASEKTGLMVSAENYDRLSPRDRHDWDTAVDAYMEAEEAGIDLLSPPLDRIQAATAVAKEVLDHATTHIASYLNRKPKLASQNWAVFVQYLLLVKVFWHTKCIADRWDEITRTENAALVRGIYECSLLIGRISAEPAFAETLQAQALAGSEAFPYRRKANGSPDYSKIIASENGSVYPSRSSFKDCAAVIGEEHGALYDVLYPLLSNQVHFDTLGMIANFKQSGSFLMWDDADKEYLSIISLSVLVYAINTFLSIQGI